MFKNVLKFGLLNQKQDELPLNGLITWLDGNDATTITLNGTDVSKWKSKSTYVTDYNQTTASRQPFYDTTKKGVRFDNYEYLQLGSNTNYVTTVQSWFLVVEPYTNIGTSARNIISHRYNTNSGLTAFNTENNFVRYFSKTSSGVFVRSEISLTNANYALNQKSILFGQWKADDTVNLIANDYVGPVAVGANNNPTSHTTSRLGCFAASTFFLYYGYIYEVMFYNRELTTAEYNIINNYLKNKWGL